MSHFLQDTIQCTPIKRAKKLHSKQNFIVRKSQILPREHFESEIKKVRQKILDPVSYTHEVPNLRKQQPESLYTDNKSAF